MVSSIYTKNIGKKTIECLIDSSCFSRFGYNISTLHYNLDSILNYATLVKDLDPSLVLKPEIEIRDEVSKEVLMLKLQYKED